MPGKEGEGGNVVGQEVEHPDAHETFVQVRGGRRVGGHEAWRGGRGGAHETFV